MKTRAVMAVVVIGLLGPRTARAASPSWQEETVLALPSAEATGNDHFGTCVALRTKAGEDEVAVVGAYGRSVGGAAVAGAAFVFRHGAAGWVLAQTLTAPDAGPNDSFGTSCAISGDLLVVGARGVGTNGAAYVYAFGATGFSLQKKLTASDGAPDDHFGLSVAIDGGTIIVGAEGKALPAPGGEGSGAAYVFDGGGASGWSAGERIVASDPSPGDAFGWSVAVSGPRVLVGAYMKNLFRGAIYPFERSGGVLVPKPKLTASDAAPGDQLGVSLSVHGDTAVAGAFGKAQSAGAAYVFSRGSGVWTETQKLPSPAGNGSGQAVAFDGVTLLVAAPSAVGGGAVGALVGTPFTLVPPLITPVDASPSASFGGSLAVSGRVALVGADRSAGSRGRAHVFRYALPNGAPCASPSECLRGFCVDGVCCDTACGGGAPADCMACAKSKGGGSDGTCGPASPAVVCRVARGECDVADRCDGVGTTCPADQVAENGAACAGGICAAGECRSAGGAGADAGTGPPEVPSPGDDTGCGCRAASRGEAGAALLALVFGFLMAARRAARARMSPR